MSSSRADTCVQRSRAISVPRICAMKVEADEWVIGTWYCYYHLELMCVVSVGGKPRPDYHAGSQRYDWYRWHSYHAARKFQRENAELEGYIIFNLSQAERQCEERKRVEKLKGI
jgi:hypothetical protein